MRADRWGDEQEGRVDGDRDESRRKPRCAAAAAGVELEIYDEEEQRDIEGGLFGQ